MQLMTIRPKPSSWLLLLLPTSLLFFLGASSLYNKDIIGSLNLLVASAVVLYNASSVLVIKDRIVTFRRFGFVIWRIRLPGARINRGKAGEIPVLKGLILNDELGSKGYITTGLYHDQDVRRMIDQFAADGAKINTP